MNPIISYWYLQHIGSGKKIILQTGENTVGRHSSCKVVLQGNEFLSRMHAKLIVNTVKGVVLEQMNSLNGVFINKTLLKVNSQRLHDGDRIGLGVEIDEPQIVPPNYAIFILKQMCPTEDDIIQISDDDDFDGKAIHMKVSANAALVNDNDEDSKALGEETSSGIAHRTLSDAKTEALTTAKNDIETSSGKTHRTLHLPILPEVKAEALSTATNDIENIFGEPDEELLESVLQINPYVFQKLNNNIVTAGPHNICDGDVIQLEENKHENNDRGDIDNDFDENLAMSQDVLREMKEEMALGDVDLSEEVVHDPENVNLLSPMKMENDISQHFDDNNIITVDAEDKELLSKVADWSSKLLSQNIMSQIYPIDDQENLGYDTRDNIEKIEDRNILENRMFLPGLPISNDTHANSSLKSAHKSTSSSSDLDKKSESRTPSTRYKKENKTAEKRIYDHNAKSSLKSSQSKCNEHKKSSKTLDCSKNANKTGSPSMKNIIQSSSHHKSTTRKRNYAISSTDKSSDAIRKLQKITGQETSKSVKLENEHAKRLPTLELKPKSSDAHPRSSRLLKRSVSCCNERNVLMSESETDELISRNPDSLLKEQPNLGPTLITAPHLPKHRAKLKGVSAERKNAKGKSDILERQRSKDYQAEMKKKWYQKPKDQKIEYEQNKEMRRELLKKLTEKSKLTAASEKSSSNLKRKHTTVAKFSSINRSDFLTKDVPSISKKNKLDNIEQNENIAVKEKIITRRATIDCLSQLSCSAVNESPTVKDLTSQSKHPPERKEAEEVRNRRTCNRVTFADMDRDFNIQQEREKRAKRNRRVRFDDNVQIRIIERVEGANIKIRNAKDTNKLSLSTYAERREWALAIGKPQNFNDFIKGNILSWGNQWLSLRDPNEVAESDILLAIPTEFNSYKHYKETFVPLMKVELLTTIEREYKNSTSTYQVKLESFSNETTRSRPRYLLITRCNNKPAKQFDLYTLYSDKHIMETFATMPAMRHMAGTTYELTFEILQNNISEDMLKSVEILTVRPVVDNMRVELGAFSALYQLGRSPLFRRILQPSEYVLSFDKHVLKNTEYKGFTKLNNYQIDICQSTWIRLIDDSTPSITLIQGPPGTGKSVVISNLALQCMYGRSNRTLDHKILICAHSNAAVDNITICLNRARNCMKHSQFDLLRFGRPDKIDSKVGNVALEHLLNNEREEKRKRLTAENTMNLVEQQKVLKAEIAELKQNTTHISCIPQMLQSKERQLRTLNELLNPPLTPRELYELSKKFIQRANIVCTTLSSCVKLASYIDYFDTCIIDEATQCTEPWTLLPLQFGVRGLVLVGDTQQLPATVLSQKAIDLGLGNSMFDRIQRNLTYHQRKSGKNHIAHTKVYKLSMQYRMHPEICRWPNSYFYHDQLVNAENTKLLTSPIIPYCVVNLSYTKETNDRNSRSISNYEEAHFVSKLLTELNKHMPTTRYRYGLITPYSSQCSVLNEVIPSHMMIIPQTVDAYQGQERDVIIISNARTRGVGFLSNFQRLNVAITRPRRCLIICGNFDDLKAVDMWRHLLDDARNRQIYFNLKKTDIGDLYRSLISKILVKPNEIIGE
ncbi:hypothetical protein KR093_004239 [Drosophila rubida]|uniref:FHA domain-containing protein n=1 Tax=Drosophila rubida TaxID=30044 RepID=A0AAD4JXW8_9MUSC|nr:hypothetical protein KR093_004239 [Drosophila rubida]